MIKKKICMLGSFAVGKTSLVQRYVRSIFSEKYHTTIGVKIDQKQVLWREQPINLILWDIHGEDDFQKVQTTYLLGASAFFMVVDGTRKHTLSSAFQLHELAIKTMGPVPFILLLNKYDLTEEWEFDTEIMDDLKKKNWTVLTTSAKSGVGVEEAFQMLVQAMMEP